MLRSAAILLAACELQNGYIQGLLGGDKPVVLLENYGNGGFAVETDVPEAQEFFSNGTEFAGAFAHREAVDAMAEAVRLDPACDMCLAGHAYTLGPTLNFGKTMEEREDTLAIAEEALDVASLGESEFETGFALALIERYRPEDDVEARDLAYAEALATLELCPHDPVAEAIVSRLQPPAGIPS